MRRTFARSLPVVFGVAFVFSDQILSASASAALKVRDRSLGADDARIELSGLRTSLLVKQSVSIERLRVDLPGFTRLAIDDLRLEWSSRANLWSFLFPAAGADRTIDRLHSAGMCDVQMTQNVLVSIVASAPGAGLSLGSSIVGGVVDAVVNISTGGTVKSATTNNLSIALLQFQEVRLRTFAGEVELPATVCVKDLKIERMTPRISSLPFAIVDCVSILVRTVVSSSTASVGTLLNSLSPLLKQATTTTTTTTTTASQR
jgi:hypothetical protein